MHVVVRRVRHGSGCEYGFVDLEMRSGMRDAADDRTCGAAAVRVRSQLVEGQGERWNWLVVRRLRE